MEYHCKDGASEIAICIGPLAAFALGGSYHEEAHCLEIRSCEWLQHDYLGRKTSLRLDGR